MNIYFYTAGRPDSSKQFFDRLKKRLAGDAGTSPLHTLEEIDVAKSITLRSGDVLILYAETRDDLDTMVCRQEVFAGCRIILILPDGNRETIHKGYLIRPRFIDYKDSDLNMLIAVLGKMTAVVPKRFAGDCSVVQYA